MAGIFFIADKVLLNQLVSISQHPVLQASVLASLRDACEK
jgi:hypothetical protein